MKIRYLDTWAVVTDCKEADPVKGTKLFYSVTCWYRTRNMPEETLAHIKTILDSLDIKYDTLQKMIQPDCLCKIAEILLGPVFKVFIKFLQ